MDGVETPPIILGDGAFPIKYRIMKPRVDAVSTPEKAYFNYRLSRARMIMEDAFGKLKGRFRVLFHKCESKQETENYMGLVCVVLNNLCMIKKTYLGNSIYHMTT